jgi:acyl carrier protein
MQWRRPAHTVILCSAQLEFATPGSQGIKMADRRQISVRVRASESTEAGYWPSPQDHTILDRMVEVIRESLYHSDHPITAATRLVEDIGLDSLDLIEVGIDIEDTFRVELPDDAIVRFRTVGELANFVQRKLCWRGQVVQYEVGEF